MSGPIDALSASHRLLIRRLSAFAGSFSLDAMVSIAHDVDGMSPFTGEMLQDLVEHDMVNPTEGDGDRHLLGPAARAHAEEARRDHNADADARGAHLAWARSLAEEANRAIDGPEQIFWLEALDAEEDNLRTALGWGCELAACEDALRLASALGRYWEIRGRIREGRRWLAAALKANPQAPAQLKAAGVSSAGLLALRDRDRADARRLYEQSLELQWEIGDRRGAAGVLHSLGNISFEQHDFGEALRLFQESLTIGRDVGDDRIVAASLTNIGAVAEVQGNLGQARSLYEEALDRWNRQGDTHNAAAVRANLTSIATAGGDLDGARRFGEDALAARRLLGNPASIVASLRTLAAISERRGEPAMAVAYLAEARSIESSAAQPTVSGDRAPSTRPRPRVRMRFPIRRNRPTSPEP